jgi:hypothetical protein
LVEKLFTLSINDVNNKQRARLNPSDELPLYAECVEKAINDSHLNNGGMNLEYIKLNIEWRSFEDISK